MGAPAVRDLDLDLDAFEGPFDLLLTLVLKEELALSEVEIAEIVITFVQELVGDRPGGAGLAPAELAVGGEFLVLVAALLEDQIQGRYSEEERKAGLERLPP